MTIEQDSDSAYTVFMLRRLHEKTAPLVTVIIPSRDGEREGMVPRLLASVRKQSFDDYEILLVIGIAPQGKAINQGAAAARGRYLLILDDDTELADETVFARLVEVSTHDATIGMAGASIVPGPDATAFQRKAAAQFPRFHTPVVSEVTESDYACHGCCLMPVEVFEAIDGEREDIIRGLDPDLRQRLRAAGYRIVLVPHARVYHPMPDSWRTLLCTFFRNGHGSAYAWKYQPDSVYETHEGDSMASFRPKTSLAFRLLRFPLRLLKAGGRGQWLRLGAYISYAFGYLWGLLTARESAVAKGN